MRVVVVVACCVAGPVGDEYLQEGEFTMRDVISGAVILRTQKREMNIYLEIV